MRDAGSLVSLLALLQLSDSAFPSGRYTLSYGLEAYAQNGLLPVPCEPTMLAQLLADQVRFAVAPADATALACAHRATARGRLLDLTLAARADERLSAVKLAREARESSLRTGRALLATAATVACGAALAEYAALVDERRVPGNHAVVLGIASASIGVPRLDAVAGELSAFAAGWVAAAVRLGLADHREAQTILSRVRPCLAGAALRAVDGDVVDISSCTPLSDVMSMRHEEADLRLFAS